MSFFKQEGDLIAVPFGNNTIEQGQFVTVDTSGNAEAGKAGNKAFLGVAAEATSVVMDDKLKVHAKGAFPASIVNAIATDLGKEVALVDANTVTTTVGSNTVIGKIVKIVTNKTVIVNLK